MKLRSKNKLKVNSGVTGTKDAFIEGVLQIEQINISVNLSVIFQYQYLDINDPEKPVSVEVNSTAITQGEQQSLYQAVKGNLPDINVDYSAWYLRLLYESFRIEMATTFGIKPEEIEVIE